MKTTLVLLAALSPFIAHCDTSSTNPTPPQAKKQHAPSAVFLSSPNYTFEMSFTALYLKPVASNLDYAVEAKPLEPSAFIPLISPGWSVQKISPDYHFGFDAGLAGIFHSANAILAVNWERFHSPKESAAKSVGPENLVGPFFEVGTEASAYKKAKGWVNFHFDEVNLNYGVFTHLGDRLSLHLFGGASFARIEQHRFTKFSNYGDSIVRTIKVPSKFVGVGPQLGLNFAYQIIRGFQFVGHTRATLFFGDLTSKTTVLSTSPLLAELGGPNPNIQKTKVHDRKGMVPGFEGKLGLAYDFEFCRHYMVTLEAGYQAQIYLNSIRSIDICSEVDLGAVAAEINGTTGVYARTFSRTISDFALAGPYLTLALGF